MLETENVLLQREFKLGPVIPVATLQHQRSMLSQEIGQGIRMGLRKGLGAHGIQQNLRHFSYAFKI